jgi:hypothetical protein
LTRIPLLLVAVYGTHALAQNQTPAPIDAEGRVKWFVHSSVGPASLAGGVISAGWGTMLNSPREYGPHWNGFGKRYGMRLTGVVTGNAMEASLGAVWGEDPRYPRAVGKPFGERVRQVVRMTFLARGADGGAMPAYARYAAIAGNNFLSNTWRVSSEADSRHALTRIGWGFAGRMASNAFREFWPSVRGAIGRKHGTP